MNFNKHFNLEGKHAIISPSKSASLIKKDDDAFRLYFLNTYASEIGTALHDIARGFIQERIKMKAVYKPVIVLMLVIFYKIPRYAIDIDKYYDNLMVYVNDAIGYRMSPEVVLAYSDNCFGTADAIDYNEKTKFLRIHDLKTGTSPVHMEQLMAYAALFCLEYNIKPADISMELRIYQMNEVTVFEPTVADILPIMDVLVHDDIIISNIKSEGN